MIQFILAFFKKTPKKPVRREFIGDWIVEHPAAKCGDYIMGHRFVIPKGIPNPGDCLLADLVRSTNEKYPFTQVYPGKSVRQGTLKVWRRSPDVQIPFDFMVEHLEVANENGVTHIL